MCKSPLNIGELRISTITYTEVINKLLLYDTVFNLNKCMHGSYCLCHLTNGINYYNLKQILDLNDILSVFRYNV